MLDYTVFFSLFSLVCCSVIVTKEHVEVDFGGSASLSCSLPKVTGVKQVTWQRLVHDESVHTMVTISDSFRHQVSQQYEDKVELTQATLNATTISIHNVTFTDQGCYVCTFNVYPSGTERRRTCLSVLGLAETTISKSFPNSAENTVVVSCSATGKPAPVVSWRSTDKEVTHYFSKNSTLNNDDGTITTTDHLTLPLPEFSGKLVECVAKSGNIEMSKHIVIDNRIVTESAETSRKHLSSVLAVICVMAVICIGMVLYRRRKECRNMGMSDLMA